MSRRLFETIDFSGDAILDPAAGFGHIVVAARTMGLRAFGTDLVKRSPLVAGGRDFLDPAYRLPPPAGGREGLSIVCNPPFLETRKFVERALGLATGRVAMLAAAHRLAAMGALLEALPLTRILFLTPRPSMWPGAVYRARVEAGKALGQGRQDFCWLLFTVGGRFRGEMRWLRRDGTSSEK